MEKNGRGKWNKTEEEFLNNPYHKEARKREKSKKKRKNRNKNKKQTVSKSKYRGKYSKCTWT